jgi:hypothetical protein
MKHSPMLLLGLSSLALSSAPAYAADSLNFDPSQLSLDRPHLLAQSSKPAPSQFESSDDLTSNWQLPATKPTHQAADQSRTESTRLSPDHLPLFVPPAEAEPSSADKAAQPHRSPHSHKAQAAEQPIATPFEFPVGGREAELFESEPAIATPFEFPVDLDDTELFEANSAESASSEPQPARDPGLEFSSAEQFEQLFDSLQPDPAQPSQTEQLEQNDSTRVPPPLSQAARSDGELNGGANNGAKSGDRADNRTTARTTGAIGLNFEPAPSPSAASKSASALAGVPSTTLPVAKATDATEPRTSEQAKPAADGLEPLFTGESDSIVAIAVGSAEGTRTPNGSKNPAYQGHVDPGNGVWNLGSFSYQHGANSPEEADTKQLARLRSQASTIFERATAKGLKLTLEEKLNGIDLANQAPKAALDDQGYVDRLAEAYSQGLSGNEAILWARVQSFIDPRTQTWDAPGLGNSEERITRDQERRMLAIAQAIANYLQDVAKRPVTQSPEEQTTQRSPPASERMAQSFAQLVFAHS